MMPDPFVSRVPDAQRPLNPAQIGEDVEPDDHYGIGSELLGKSGDCRDPSGRNSPVRPETLGQTR